MPTDPAFIRAVEGLKRDVPELQYAPDRVLASAVRDVLNAIREPDEEVVRAGWGGAGTSKDGSAMGAAFTAMIDAILIQGEGGQRDGVSYDYWLAERAVGSGQTRITPIGTINSATGEVQYPTGEEG